MKSPRRARIGLVLIVIGVVSAFAWWYLTGYVFLTWYWSYQISALVFAALAVAPSIVLTVAGLASYGVSRKAFWAPYTRGKGLLAYLGLAFMFVGGFFLAYIYTLSVYAASKPEPQYAKPLTYYLANNAPYFVLFALWLITGLWVFADALETYWRREK